MRRRTRLYIYTFMSFQCILVFLSSPWLVSLRSLCFFPISLELYNMSSPKFASDRLTLNPTAEICWRWHQVLIWRAVQISSPNLESCPNQLWVLVASPTNFLEFVLWFNVSLSEDCWESVRSQSRVSQESVRSQSGVCQESIRGPN